MWLPDFLSSIWKRARQTARSIIGVPDYDAYLQHCREHHSGQTPMSYAEFFAERQTARYKGTGGRCC